MITFHPTLTNPPTIANPASALMLTKAIRKIQPRSLKTFVNGSRNSTNNTIVRIKAFKTIKLVGIIPAILVKSSSIDMFLSKNLDGDISPLFGLPKILNLEPTLL